MGSRADGDASRVTGRHEWETERLAILVHEVRSPVAALRAIADAAEPDDAELRVLVTLAIAACRGIARVVRDATLASVELEDVDPGRLVHEVAASAALAGARVRAVAASGLPQLRADPLRLRQALDNLVSNALIHARVDDEVVVSAEVAGGLVRLSVTDAGEGIALEDQSRIFEAGARLDDEGPGAGLGLAVARAIAEAHGGTVTVESTPVRGSTFTIALPVAETRSG